MLETIGTILDILFTIWGIWLLVILFALFFGFLHDKIYGSRDRKIESLKSSNDWLAGQWQDQVRENSLLRTRINEILWKRNSTNSDL